MTVCIGAICEGNTIFGASDRMITGGDIQFEVANSESPPSKIFMLTNSIVAMTAGDVGVQREILEEVCVTVRQRVNKDPGNWWEVKDIVDLYVTAYDRISMKRSRSAVLAPLGLDENTFIQRQKEMTRDFVDEVRRQLEHFSLPKVETIVAGKDVHGPHVFILNGTEIICADSVGFGAIGSGRRHAQSEIMLAGHEPTSQAAETLFLTYLAKKRAEIAPGVGKFTDMVKIGPELGSAAVISRSHIDRLEEIYQQHLKREADAWKKAKDAARQYADELKRASKQEDQKPAPESAAA
ncbi:MAG: hypothetical protein JWM35_1651 [Verrucomicrobia bacterium]|nr:hypothetical protein [Verrucomicrobiota bacterium]